jgi:hypothetical protein
MNATAIPNERAARKQLSDQLDRLDGILDALGEGLNGAVAEAAREGTRLAVKDALVEMMTDPALRARLHQATAPAPEPAQPERRSGFWGRLKAKAGQALKSIGRIAANVAKTALGGAKAVAGTARYALRACQGSGCGKKLARIGLAFGVARFAAPHAIGAAWSRDPCRRQSGGRAGRRVDAAYRPYPVACMTRAPGR